jgi:hypothetical protein
MNKEIIYILNRIITCIGVKCTLHKLTQVCVLFAMKAIGAPKGSPGDAQPDLVGDVSQPDLELRADGALVHPLDVGAEAAAEVETQALDDLETILRLLN